MTVQPKSNKTNDKGGELGRCTKCGYELDSCMEFDWEDWRKLKCPGCGIEQYYNFYFDKSWRAEYDRRSKQITK